MSLNLKELRKLATEPDVTEVDSNTGEPLTDASGNPVVPKTQTVKKPAASKSSVVIDPKYCNMKLSDQAAPGNVGYDYQTSADGKSLQYKTKASSGPWKTLGQSYPKWDDVVTAINALGKKTSDETVPAGQAANATEVEASKPAEQPVATPVITNLVSNVAKILSNIRAGSTYAGRTVFRNEKAMVQKMLTALDTAFADATNDPAIKAIGSAPNALALIITKKDATLESGALASVSPSDLAKLNDKQISKAYQRDLDAIMSVVRSLHEGKFAENVGQYMRFVVGTVNASTAANQAAAPATTPTGPVQPVKPPEKTSSKYPAKIIRLASLRRLRVRSEMEAAITGSAMPGRDRVV